MSCNTDFRLRSRIGTVSLLLVGAAATLGLREGHAASRVPRPVSGFADPVRLASPTTTDKYPSLATDASGRLWLSWVSMSRGEKTDTVFVRSQDQGVWGPPVSVSSRSAIEGLPSIAVGRNGDVLVFWTAMRDGNWDIHSRRMEAGRWQPEERATTHEAVDGHATTYVTSNGVVWLVWESSRLGQYDIFAKYLDGGEWSQPLRVSHSGQDDRRPAIVSDRNGRVWVAWDSPRSGNYEIFLSSWDGSGWSPADRVTTDGGVDDSPSLAADPRSGDLWIAWNSNRDSKTSVSTKQRNYYDIVIRVLRDGRWYEPKAPEGARYPGQVSTSRRIYNDWVPNPYYQDRPSHAYPKLIVTESGDVWVFWRADIFGNFKDYHVMARKYSASEWSDEIRVSQVEGHASQVDATVSAAGGLWVAWQGQERFPLEHDIYLARREAATGSGDGYVSPVLKERVAGGGAADDRDAPKRLERGTITTATGDLHVYYGDIHAHSSLTDGKSGLPDQLFTFARDDAKLDFFAMTDHADFDRFSPTEWALARARAAYFNAPGKFVTFSGFEWNPPLIGSVTKEGGHRCVVYPTDDQPIYAGDEAQSNSIRKLYSLIEKTGGIVIAHHIAHARWGRWNPENYAGAIEPVMEIASTHGRFEYYGNPLNHKARPQVPGHSYQDALARGYRLGVVASSDTHHMRPGYMGQVAVWAPELRREAIFEAIKRRRTYATTGERVVLDFRVDGHLMGEEYEAAGPPEITATVESPSPILIVDVVKNNRVIHTIVREDDYVEDGTSLFFEYDESRPQESVSRRVAGNRRIELHFTDEQFDPGRSLNYYYLRVALSNDDQAWSSPVWTTKP